MIGSNNVFRRLRPYMADRNSATANSGLVCGKKQLTTRQLMSDIMIIWCTGCTKAVLFALMTDSKSPRTIFELLYTYFESVPTRFQFDNGCNVHRHPLHREPAFFKQTQSLIDKLGISSVRRLIAQVLTHGCIIALISLLFLTHEMLSIFHKF